MTLYEFLVNNGDDYDTYDEVFDSTITVCINLEPEDDYDEFAVGLCKLVEVKGIDKYDGNPICGWSDLINNNIDVFRKFADEHWYKNNYKDNDRFVCEWLSELHLLLAGYGEDGKYGFYKQEIVDKCHCGKEINDGNVLKELINGCYYIYQVEDGGCGIVKANTSEEAYAKVVESYNKHGVIGEPYYCCEDVDVFQIKTKIFDDTPDVIELGWSIETND